MTDDKKMMSETMDDEKMDDEDESKMSYKGDDEHEST